MKTIIAGSRTIFDYDAVLKAISDSGFVITEVFCGGAGGVDSLGNRWAYSQKIPVRWFRPDWVNLGKAAGHIRNFEMAAFADQLIAVWDGRSTGTKSMIEYAKKCNVKTHIHIVAPIATLVDQGRANSQHVGTIPTGGPAT